MDILCFSYGLAYANMYVLRFGNEAIVIDPCCPWDETGFSDVSVKAVLCTHGHFDHISEAEEILARFSCPLYISEYDRNMLPDPELNHSSSFGLHVSVNAPSASFPKESMSSADLGLHTENEFILQVVPTPGHTSGSVCFLFVFKDDHREVMFTGDTLFRRGIGRTDLGGSEEEMRRSIDLLRTMNDDIECYPGHGSKTDLRSEKRLNPFF